MSIPGLPTPQDQVEYYQLARNVAWRYRLDDAEEAVIKRLVALIAEMREEVSEGFLRYRPGQITRTRLEALLREVGAYSDSVKEAALALIAEESGAVLGASLAEHASILSMGGQSPNVAAVGISATGVGSLMMNAEVDGLFLRGWIDSAFSGWNDAYAGIVRAGMIRGDSYRKIVKELTAKVARITEHDAVSVARTYIQTANVRAQESVYQQNSDIIGWVKWSAILEPSYKQTGRGTCLICAALDGTRYRLNANKPEMPNHIRCRCVWVPVVDWAMLGVPELAVEDTVRPYTIRGNLNIDTGGKRKILEAGMHKSDWASWAEERSEEFQIDALGPNRFRMWKESRLSLRSFMDMLIPASGEKLRTIPQLEVILR